MILALAVALTLTADPVVMPKARGYSLETSTLAGAAVMNHPSNPPSTWHVVRLPHMLNPCICRDGPVAIGANGLTLRYRVVAHDGPADGAALDALYDAFAKA